MNYFYSTDTGEIILTDNPAEWMGSTAVAPPTYDSATAGCFWRGTAWEIVVPTPEAAPIPKSVTRAQAKAALLLAGKLAQVQPAIDAITDPMQRGLVQIDWDDRLVFERSNSTLIALSAALGMSEAALDALFVAGAAL